MPSNNENVSLTFSWLKFLWLPITGFLGAVTIAVQFIELWKGNQNLVSWVFFGLGYLATLSSVGYIAFAKQVSPVDQSRKIPLFPNLYTLARWSFILIAVVPFISLGYLRSRIMIDSSSLSCSSAEIVSPEGSRFPANAGNNSVNREIEVSWMPSNCVMTIMLVGSGSEGVYFNRRSGEVFDIGISKKGSSGILEISIWPYGTDYETSPPADTTYYYIE